MSAQVGTQPFILFGDRGMQAMAKFEFYFSKLGRQTRAHRVAL
jgi:hypothetical protein